MSMEYNSTYYLAKKLFQNENNFRWITIGKTWEIHKHINKNKASVENISPL